MQTQLREEVYITNGRIMVRGRMTKRAAGKRVDYILYYKPNIPVAIIEAKDNNHRVGDGMQQALEYAEMIDVPFVFSSNGDAFLAHDRSGASMEVEREIPLDHFPSPKELWRRYCAYKGLTPEIEAVVAQDSCERDYLLLFLRSPLAYGQATASITGTAQPTVPLRPLRRFVVPVPPLAEQKRIVAKVDQLMKLCDDLETKLQRTETTAAKLVEAVVAEMVAA